MSRWIFVGAALVVLVLLGLLVGSPALHTAGDADCSALGDDAGEPTHATHESDMYAEDSNEYTDCPVDDAAAMGGS